MENKANEKADFHNADDNVMRHETRRHIKGCATIVKEDTGVNGNVYDKKRDQE